MRFELHCHSTCSDGTEPPERVAARAAARDVAVFALTDHDSCAGTPATLGGAGRARVVRGVELSCDDAGRTVHVLAFDRGGAWDALEARIASVREARKNRVRVMAARLSRRGVVLDVEPLLAEAEHRAIGRPDLARAIVAAGAASSVKDAFARHLYDGGPVDEPHRALPLDEAIAIGRDAGAALSLAHPHLYEDRAAQYMKRYKAQGLTGIEAYYGAYDARERSRWIQLADQLGAVCTGGSDWHGPDVSSVEPGIDLPDERSEALLAWLSAPPG